MECAWLIEEGEGWCYCSGAAKPFTRLRGLPGSNSATLFPFPVVPLLHAEQLKSCEMLNETCHSSLQGEDLDAECVLQSIFLIWILIFILRNYSKLWSSDKLQNLITNKTFYLGALEGNPSIEISKCCLKPRTHWTSIFPTWSTLSE